MTFGAAGAELSGDELLIVTCGTWAARVLDLLDSLDPGAGQRTRRLSLFTAETESGATASESRIALLSPSAEAFRRHLTGLDVRALLPLAPAAWLPDVKAALHGGLAPDARSLQRYALLVAEARIRRRLRELVQGCSRVLLVGAPAEALCSAGLPLLARWSSEESATESPARVTLLLALDPLGSAAERDPAGGAQLHAALAALDQGRVAADILVLGQQDLSRDALVPAAAEILAWWARGGHALLGPVTPHEGAAQSRGRSATWRGVSAATATASVDQVARDQSGHVAEAVGRALLGPRTEPCKELAGHAARTCADITGAVGLPTGPEIEQARHEGAAPADPALASRSRVERALEKISSQAAEAKDAARRAVLGGAINRLGSSASTAYLDLQVDWLWQLILARRATLDEVVSTLLSVSVSAQAADAARLVSEFERVATDAEARAARRQKEGATPALIAAAHAHQLRAASVRARCEVAAVLLGEAGETIGRVTAALAAARSAVAALPRLVLHERPLGARSPWRTSIPMDAASIERSLGTADSMATAWLADLAASATSDRTRGLARPAEALADHLRGWCKRSVAQLFEARPVGELEGLGSWFGGFLARVPQTVAFDGDALPGGEPSAQGMVFATKTAAPRLAAALPSASSLVGEAEPTTLGWLSLTDPFTLHAVAGIAATRAALETESAAGRILPLESERDPHGDARCFREPAPGDLAWRVLRALGASGLADRVPTAVLRCLDARTLPNVQPALAALAALAPAAREQPALRQAAVLGDWAALKGLGELTAVERGAQGVSALREPDGTDADLVDAMVLLGGLAGPVKKSSETTSARQTLAHLTGAAQALDAARIAAETTLAGVDRAIVLGLATRWSEWIAAALAGLRGRSDPQVTLRTHRLLVRGHATLLVEVENRGRHAVLAARLALLDSPQFRVLGAATHDLGEIPPGARRSLAFPFKPSATGTVMVELSLAWDDQESSGKQSSTSGTVELIAEPPAFRRIERNPYIAGPPVRSAEMFFGRQDVFDFVSDNLAGRHQDNVLILHGQRRTGKSSILIQLERRDILPEHLPVVVDLQGLGGFDTATLLYQLARHASRRLARVEGATPPMPDRAVFRDGPYDAFQEHLDALEGPLEASGRRLLFMIDEFDALEGHVESGDVQREVFPFLRHLMQHRERLAFLLAGTQQLVAMRHDYWSILFSLASYRKVSFLPADAARELVQKPLEGEVVFDDLVLESLLRLTAGHPYYLQLTCQNLVQRLNQSATRACVDPEDLEAVLPEVLAAGGGHFEHEWRTLPSDLCRAVLSAMAASDDTGMLWFGAEDVARTLSASGLAGRADADGVATALSQLAAREVVEEAAGRGAWRIRIDLLRLWLRRHHPRALAAAGATMGPA